MKINKCILIVLIINIALLGWAIYAFAQYKHKTAIVASTHPITDFVIMEVNCSSGYRGGSSVRIACNNNEYYTGIPNTLCKTGNVEKLAYYYDSKNDVIFWERELDQRYIVFYFILFLFSLLLWLYPEVHKRKKL